MSQLTSGSRECALLSQARRHVWSISFYCILLWWMKLMMLHEALPSCIFWMYVFDSLHLTLFVACSTSECRSIGIRVTPSRTGPCTHHPSAHLQNLLQFPFEKGYLINQGTSTFSCNTTPLHRGHAIHIASIFFVDIFLVCEVIHLLRTLRSHSRTHRYHAF